MDQSLLALFGGALQLLLLMLELIDNTMVDLKVGHHGLDLGFLHLRNDIHDLLQLLMLLIHVREYLKYLLLVERLLAVELKELLAEKVARASC